MPAISYLHDDCQTASDVWMRAAKVRERREQMRSALSPTPPQIVYVPITKLVKPSIVEMLHAIADHYKIEQIDLLESIARVMRPVDTKYASIVDIQTAVALHADIALRDMISARRTADAVWPRQIAMALCKRLTLKSLPEIGRKFGGRDHTTILHAVRKLAPLVEYVEKLMAPDASLDDWARAMVAHYDEVMK